MDWPDNYQEVFWKAYPRKEAKKEAMKALDKLFKTKGVRFELILSGINKLSKENQFIPLPASYLRREDFVADSLDLTPELLAAHASMVPKNRVHIKMETPQWEAWRKYRKSIGKPMFANDRDLGWWVESEYPPVELEDLEPNPFL